MGVLVQTALAAVDRTGTAGKVFLDPRPEVRQDWLSTPVVDSLKRLGFQEYAKPGIPPSDVLLLSPGGITELNDSTQVSARFWAFGDKDRFLNAYTYLVVVRAEAAEGGFVLGPWLSPANGDGHVSPECWEDFFSRGEEGRKECFGIPHDPGSVWP